MHIYMDMPLKRFELVSRYVCICLHFVVLSPSRDVHCMLPCILSGVVFSPPYAGTTSSIYVVIKTIGF